MFIISNQRLLIKWVLISCMGWLIAQTIGIVLTRAAYPQAEFNTLLTAPLYWITFGIVFGFSQWIVLRDYVPNIRGWILATALGFYLAALLLKLLFRSGVILPSFLAYISSGMIIGFAQYQVLKRRLRRTILWIPMVTVGWVVAQELIRLPESLLQFLGIIFFTIITGLMLAWPVQNPYPEAKSE